MQLPRLIGITGKAGAGKDTIADYLVKHFGYTRYGLADPLKKLLMKRFGINEAYINNRTTKEAAHPAFGYGELIDGVPRYYSLREWMQWLGTEASRELHGEDCWINIMEREWHAINATNETTFGELQRMVIPDLRYDNEADRIRKLGGTIIAVVRPGVAPVATHKSEDGVNSRLIDQTIINDSDINTLIRRAIDALANQPEKQAA